MRHGQSALDDFDFVPYNCMDIIYGTFVWDADKERVNIAKHGVDFETAALAFADPLRKIIRDRQHSESEDRFFCIGSANEKLLTVRFTYRGDRIRIIGAGDWRKQRRYYEEDSRP